MSIDPQLSCKMLGVAFCTYNPSGVGGGRQRGGSMNLFYIASSKKKTGLKKSEEDTQCQLLALIYMSTPKANA